MEPLTKLLIRYMGEDKTSMIMDGVFILRKISNWQKNGRYADQVNRMDGFTNMNLIALILRYLIFRRKMFCHGLQN